VTATNHVITGAVIGAGLSNPFLALPVAFLSHILLDVIPHFGYEDHLDKKLKISLLIDLAFASSLLLLILLLQPQNWPLIFSCAVAAAILDLWWLPAFVRELKTGKRAKLDKVGQFLSDIQKYEKPAGIIIEAVWFVAMFILFLRLTA
jgi:hypothetical protein